MLVRKRLINLDDALLPGMGPFAHGAFNKTRIIVYADELDGLITSTRESIKEAPAYADLKQYLTKKFNELHKYWLQKNAENANSQDVSYKLSSASYALTRGPIFHSAQHLLNNPKTRSVLMVIPEFQDSNQISEFISSLEEDLESEKGIIHKYEEEYISPSLPVCRLDLETRTIYLNVLHPFVIFCLDSANDISSIRLIATAEILNEAQLIEANIDDDKRIFLVKRRDQILREISSIDKINPAAIAQLIADSEQNANGLEEAAVIAFKCLGFDAVSIGGSGKPDGLAIAHLGISDGIDSSFIVTIDAKSTKHSKASSGNINISNIDNHRIKYEAQFAVIIAPGYEGIDDENSKINVEARKFSKVITCITTTDLIKLVSMSGPKQISLAKLRDLFENCATPLEASNWIAQLEKLVVSQAPYNEIIETAYEMQKNDTERPTLSSIRISNPILNKFSLKEIRGWVEVLERQLPEFVSLDDDIISLNNSPANIKKTLQMINSDLPPEFKNMYKDAFGTAL